jgi:hypothetical protein
MNNTLSGIMALVVTVGGLAACSVSIGDKPDSGDAGKSPTPNDGGTRSDSSEAAAVVDSGPDADAAMTTCTANFTIENVAFYGTGTEAAPASSCPTVTPPFPEITSSSNLALSSDDILFGDPTSLWNTYAPGGQVNPTVSLAPSTGALTISGSATAEAGTALFGLGLNFVGTSCLNASAYTGVSFTVTGDLGGCALQFSVIYAEDQTPALDTDRGECTASVCYPSFTSVSTGAVTVPFTTPTGGMPQVAVDSTAITALQWGLYAL